MRLFALLLFILISTPVTANAYEGAGLIRSDLKGALPKGLWRNQYRSEISYLLKNLPAQASSRTYQDMKHKMLISTYDTRGIINDVPADGEHNLLALRLHKLLETGFWEDAFKLYTNNVDDPGDNDALAQIGLILILNEQGLSTACLEEKVLFERFTDKPFWQQIDKVCSLELGTVGDNEIYFSNSSILQAIYFDKDFKVSVNNIDLLSQLSPLELSLMALKGRIDYTGFKFSDQIPPILTKTFLKDEDFPKSSRSKLEELAISQALFPRKPLTEKESEALKDPAALSQKDLMGLIIKQLRLGQKISAESGARLMELAPTHPENYFFVKVLNSTNSIYGNKIPSGDNFNLGIEALRKKHPQNVILLLSELDKPAQFSNNLSTAYEKRVGLTPEDGYVMSNGSPETWNNWLEEANKQNFSGISLLIILSNIEDTANGMNDENVIKSLSTVGLINQAHHLAKEKLVDLMQASLLKEN